MTSNTIASAPDANFLHIILLAINDILSTVAVTSLSAYIFLSATAIDAVCPHTAILCLLTDCINFSGSISIENPGIASSLSNVPPVCPRPLPDILATGALHAATNGANAIVVLSPTPPVLCLSTLIPFIADRSITSPEFIIASVRNAVSSLDILFIYIAIKRADA